jgi:hypothetical protein
MNNAAPGQEATPRSNDENAIATAFGDELTSSSADLRWNAAADALLPDKSLTRINANARATVSTVAFVGTAITALGLVSATSLLSDNVARWFATSAAVLSILAVIASIAFLALRLERLNIDDLNEIERWYGRQFRRSYLAVAGSWLLLAAVICGGIAAGTALTASMGSKDVAMNMQVFGTGIDRSLKLDGVVSGLEDGAILETTVVALAGNGCPESVLLSTKSKVRRTGEVVLSGTVKLPQCSSDLRLDLLYNGAELDSMTFR